MRKLFVWSTLALFFAGGLALSPAEAGRGSKARTMKRGPKGATRPMGLGRVTFECTASPSNTPPNGLAMGHINLKAHGKLPKNRKVKVKVFAPDGNSRIGYACTSVFKKGAASYSDNFPPVKKPQQGLYSCSASLTNQPCAPRPAPPR